MTICFLWSPSRNAALLTVTSTNTLSLPLLSFLVEWSTALMVDHSF